MGSSYFAVVLIAVSLAARVICNPQNQPASIKEWCAKTYNPKPCEDLLANDPKYSPVNINGKADFIKLSLQLAYDRAVNASKLAHALGPKCKSQGEKAALDKCVELYDANVVNLNQTMNHNYICSPREDVVWELNVLGHHKESGVSRQNCTAFDVLAASLNTVDDCEDGFVEINMTDNVMNLIHDSVLEDLIINVLALVANAPKEASKQIIIN